MLFEESNDVFRILDVANNFNITVWIVQSVLVMLALLLLIPIFRALIGLGLLFAAQIVPSYRLALQRRAKILLPVMLQAALGLSLLAQPASATTLAAIYVVQPGDSLWSIAAETVNQSAHPTAAKIEAEWRRLWQLNYEVIGSDPAQLPVGARLRLAQDR